MKKIELKVDVRSPKATVGWLETELPKSIMSRLQSYIETAKKNPTNINSFIAALAAID